MSRLGLTLPLACLIGLLISQGAAAQELRPAPLTTLASHFCYLRVLSGTPADDCAPQTGQEAAICCGQDEPPPSPTRRPTYSDADALAFKLAPRELKRHGIGFELSEIFPLGTQRRRACGAADHFLFSHRLARSCLMDDRPDSQGFEFVLGYPLQEATRFVLGIQAEEGGRLGRSDLRSLIGFSFSF